MQEFNVLMWDLMLVLGSMGIDFEYDFEAIHKSEVELERAHAAYWWHRHVSLESLHVVRAVNVPVSDGNTGWCERRVKSARAYVKRKNENLLEVFNLVIKNGNNREASICELMKTMNGDGEKQQQTVTGDILTR